MSWALVVTAPEDELELLAAELFAQGAQGVELQEPGQLLMPGTAPLPAGLGRAIAHFDARADAAEAAEALRGMGHSRFELPVEVQEEDWSVAWRAHHHPMRVGKRSWVYPPWEDPPCSFGEACVVIDPGMAFGTGSHPTTSLCLERCDELLHDWPGASVLDVGTGSGVIALLAAKLGAGRVAGTENDPVALDAARRAVEPNALPPGRIEWHLEDPDAVPGQFDVVFANILLNTLEELAPQIARKVAPDGHLVLSGLLATQGDAAEAAYVAQGLRPAARQSREGWLRVELVRPL